MVKNNWIKKYTCFLVISFLIISCGCEMPWDKTTGSTSSTKYAGTYKGTVRSNLNSYPETIYPIDFIIDSNGDLTSPKTSEYFSRAA